jgi:hypothetical protein
MEQKTDSCPQDFSLFSSRCRIVQYGTEPPNLPPIVNIFAVLSFPLLRYYSSPKTPKMNESLNEKKIFSIAAALK